jgi:hypothetical protein
MKKYFKKKYFRLYNNYKIMIKKSKIILFYFNLIYFNNYL